ncbi:MAG: hypothetical protein RBT05_09345, partial [Bacteroidales bacterium]|nr:hypothetical protein [Bacteroidales bacterium]
CFFFLKQEEKEFFGEEILIKFSKTKFQSNLTPFGSILRDTCSILREFRTILTPLQTILIRF